MIKFCICPYKSITTERNITFNQRMSIMQRFIRFDLADIVMNVLDNTTKQDGQYLPLAHTNLVVSLLFEIKELVICIRKLRAYKD